MKRFFTCLFVVIQLVACDSMLDVEPETKTTYTNYFKGEQDAAALLYEVHASFNNVLSKQDYVHEIVGLKLDHVDDQVCDVLRDLAPYAYESEDYNSTTWTYYYGTIYRANVILDNAYRFTEIDADRLEYYKRQACFVKGICYFFVARMWGDAPIVKNSTDAVAYPRSNVKEVLAEAIRNAEIALDLPVFEDLVNESGAKITSKQYGCKGAATALLAQIYAWRAGLFGDSEDWKKAEQYCTDIISNKVGHYELAADPKAVCVDVMKGNSGEGIFEAEYYAPDDPFFRHEPYVATSNMLGYPITGDSFTDDIFISLRMDKTTVKEMYDEADRRLDAYFYEIDSTVYHSESGMELPVETAFLYKWNYPVKVYSEWAEIYIYKTQNVNRVIWRLADIMLLRAECRARLGASNAAEDLNEIRHRAYGDWEHNYSAAEGELRYVIFKEREKELLCEGHRYYDVMRNGYWKTELTDAFARMSQQEFDMGAQYYPVKQGAFLYNDLMRQNGYWLSKGIK